MPSLSLPRALTAATALALVLAVAAPLPAAAEGGYYGMGNFNGQGSAVSPGRVWSAKPPAGSATRSSRPAESRNFSAAAGQFRDPYGNTRNNAFGNSAYGNSAYGTNAFGNAVFGNSAFGTNARNRDPYGYGQMQDPTSRASARAAAQGYAPATAGGTYGTGTGTGTTPKAGGRSTSRMATFVPPKPSPYSMQIQQPQRASLQVNNLQVNNRVTLGPVSNVGSATKTP